MKFLNLTMTALTLLTFSQAMAESNFDRKINGVKVYDMILNKEFPRPLSSAFSNSWISTVSALFF